MNIYKQGILEGVRFDSSLGMLTIEQLMELPLQSKTKESMQSVMENISKEMVAVQNFIDETSEVNEIAELKMAIAKDIVKDKKKELRLKAQAEKDKAELEKLESALENKNNEALCAMSEEEIKKRIAQLKK
jgi:hypothetical protein